MQDEGPRGRCCFLQQHFFASGVFFRRPTGDQAGGIGLGGLGNGG